MTRSILVTCIGYVQYQECMTKYTTTTGHACFAMYSYYVLYYASYHNISTTFQVSV